MPHIGENQEIGLGRALSVLLASLGEAADFSMFRFSGGIHLKN